MQRRNFATQRITLVERKHGTGILEFNPDAQGDDDIWTLKKYSSICLSAIAIFSERGIYLFL